MIQKSTNIRKGAGVLPVAVYKGKIYLLLSREGYGRNKGFYSDFGGTADSSETIKETAIRESYEESNGFLGTKSEIDKLIQNKLITKLTSLTYTTYVVEVTYDKNLPKTFKNNLKYAQKAFGNIMCKNGFYEKDKLKWVELTNIKKFLKELRPFYKKILTLDNLEKIRIHTPI